MVGSVPLLTGEQGTYVHARSGRSPSCKQHVRAVYWVCCCRRMGRRCPGHPPSALARYLCAQACCRGLSKAPGCYRHAAAQPALSIQQEMRRRQRCRCHESPSCCAEPIAAPASGLATAQPASDEAQPGEAQAEPCPGGANYTAADCPNGSCYAGEPNGCGSRSVRVRGTSGSGEGQLR